MPWPVAMTESAFAAMTSGSGSARDSADPTASVLARLGDDGLRRVLDSAVDHAVMATDGARRIMLWNAGAARLFGWGEAEVLGHPCDLIFTPEDRAAGLPEREQEMAVAQGRAPNERWHLRQDGSRFWASGWVAPLRDLEGSAVGLVKVLRDATAERAGGERLRLALEVGGGLAWELDPRTGLSTWQEAAVVRFGLPASVMPVETAWRHFMHPDDVAAIRGAIAAAFDPAGDGRYSAEHRVVGAAAGERGGVRWFQSLGQAWFEGEDDSRRAVRLVCVTTDVTTRREAEERRRLLVNELNHRVKNTLATVQSLARQTGRSAAHARDFLPAFEARLLALARAHDLLTRDDWTGATVGEVARGALAPHHGGSRVGLAGPPLRVGPRAAVALAMALQELATNAAKHGALSVPAGRVDVTWLSTPGAAPDASEGVLDWRETGGPAAVEPGPAGPRGFGLRLLTQGLRGDLGSAAELRFVPAGLRCTIRFPTEGTLDGLRG
jgi:PAS domain S-box-containing protein